MQTKVDSICGKQVQAKNIGNCIQVLYQDHNAVQSLFDCGGKAITDCGKEPSHDLLSLRGLTEQQFQQLNPYLRKLSVFLPPPLCEKQKWIHEHSEEIDHEKQPTLAALFDLYHNFQQTKTKSGNVTLDNTI